MEMRGMTHGGRADWNVIAQHYKIHQKLEPCSGKCNMTSIRLATLFPYLPADVFLFNDGTVMTEDEFGDLTPVDIRFNSNGRPYIEFFDGAGKRFQVWLLREFYRAFRGVVPENHEVYAIDGNRANLRPANLAIRPKAATRSTFKLAPKNGPPPAA